MKPILAALTLVFASASGLAQTSVAAGSSINIGENEMAVSIRGKIVGPLSFSDGTYKAFAVRPLKPITANDGDGHCGEQIIKAIPISQSGLNGFAGKNVSVTGILSCHTSLGTYHLTEAKISAR